LCISWIIKCLIIIDARSRHEKKKKKKLFKNIKNVIPKKNHFATETTDIPKKLIPSRKHVSALYGAGSVMHTDKL